ncbi:MAG: hypothetical protein QOH25_3229 [Acidobacteriota bacterium]|jgi:hypothetical protein|nr:hypothetical protein [Acidobacteriota bacterium]
MKGLINKVLYLLHLRRRELTKRPINEDEEALARQVFHDQLPYSNIHIANFYLPGNEGVAVTVASGTELIPIKALTDYTIYFGPGVFRDGAQTPDTRNTFIHELTHVWQGHHSAFSWHYMVNSMLSQGRAIIFHGDRNKAYEFTAGKAWDDYNVEQQANIVESWFAAGMQTDSDLYVYITENIRAGRSG